MKRLGWSRLAWVGLCLALGLILATKLGTYLINPKVPDTHDGENHIARFANYVAAAKDGQWPPRWAPYVLNGLGYPVFNYNYPVANILAVPLDF
jgi:hypothetical protein